MGVVTSYFTGSDVEASSASMREAEVEVEEAEKEEKNPVFFDFEDVEPDKVLMATGDSDGTIIIWDTTNGTQKEKLLYHEKDSWVYTLVLFQDEILLSCSREGKIIMTETRNFKKIGELKPPSANWIISLCVLSETSFVYGDRYGKIGVYECEDKKDVSLTTEKDFTLIELPQSHEDYVECIIKLKSRRFMNHFATSGTYMDQDCDRDYRIRVYDFVERKVSFILPEFHRNEVRRIESVIPEDGREYLISSSVDRTICIFDLSSQKIVSSIDCEERVTSMSCFTDKYVVLGSSRGTLFLKNWKNQTLQKKIEHSSDWWIAQMMFLPKSDSEESDERYLVTASNDTNLKIWSVRVEGVEFQSRKDILTSKDLEERKEMLFSLPTSVLLRGVGIKILIFKGSSKQLFVFDCFLLL